MQNKTHTNVLDEIQGMLNLAELAQRNATEGKSELSVPDVINLINQSIDEFKPMYRNQISSAVQFGLCMKDTDKYSKRTFLEIGNDYHDGKC